MLQVLEALRRPFKDCSLLSVLASATIQLRAREDDLRLFCDYTMFQLIADGVNISMGVKAVGSAQFVTCLEEIRTPPQDVESSHIVFSSARALLSLNLGGRKETETALFCEIDKTSITLIRVLGSLQ